MARFGQESSSFKGVLIMFRKVLSVALLTAMFSFALGSTDAEARHCRYSYRSNGYSRSANYGYGNSGYGYGRGGYGHGSWGQGGWGHGGYGHGGYGYGYGHGYSGYGGGNHGYGYGY